MHTKRDQERRDEIMNSHEQLPGDRARAEGEVNEDNDALDTGNFATLDIDSHGDRQKQQKVNQSDDVLPGDRQRARDDARVNAGRDNDTSSTPRDASRGPSDKINTGGQQTGGGTPAGGSSQVSDAPGINSGMVGSTDETDMARRAFGGSTTGYGQREGETDGARSETTFGGGTAGGLATGADSGGQEHGMVAGGGIEGSVNLVDEDDLTIPEEDLQPDDLHRKK